MNAVLQNPPPKTNPRKVAVKKKNTLQGDIEILAEVLKDISSTRIKGGETSFDPVGALTDGKGHTNFYQLPSYSWELKGSKKIIKKLNGPVKIKGTVKIQTAYGPGASPASQSEYGRGTTAEDERVGNTSLGFHESCHRDDFLNYLKTTALPIFSGKAGMAESQYIQASTAFGDAINKYFTDMERYSDRRTDEVGYKNSTYKTKGPRL